MYVTGTIDADAARAETFTLDAVGNWKTYLAQNGSGGTLVTQWDHDRAVNNANEITGLTQRTGTWIPPDYDARGNMVKMPRPTAPTAAFACTYDAWNRLARVFVDANSNGVYDVGTDILVGQYEYDGLGRRCGLPVVHEMGRGAGPITIAARRRSRRPAAVASPHQRARALAVHARLV